MSRTKHIAKVFAVVLIAAFALASIPLLSEGNQAAAAAKKPAQVKNLKVKGIDSNTRVRLSWNKAKYAEKYQIFEKIDGKYVLKKMLSERKAVVKAKAGTHVYKVRGVRNSGAVAGRFSAAKKVVLTVNYTDLGDYVIDLGTITADDVKAGIAEINRQNEEGSDSFTPGSCTAIVKKNSKGQTIVGRNQDMEVSNYPVYISHLDGYGKYKAVSLYYSNKGMYTYDQLRKGLKFKASQRAGLAVAGTDVLNEEGLYVQCNMRTSIGIATTSTNPGKLKTGMITAAALAAQNASTCEEAVSYIENELDIYSLKAGGWDFAFLIGDKEGRYCMVEFASDKIYVTWDKDPAWDREKFVGQANYFVSKDIHDADLYGAGYGRLDFALNSGYDEAETADDMMNAVHAADWYHEILDMKYSYKDNEGNVHFVNEEGEPSIDWRTELTANLAVDENGNIVEDESRLDKKRRLKYHLNCTAEYVTDPDNFEQVKAAAEKRFAGHDELLKKFFNGDKQPLRDDGTVFTTGMNFGVNCGDKYMKVRFLEDENCIYEMQWVDGKLIMKKQ